MNTEQSRLLSVHLNAIGVLVSWEVNGTQHKFRLNLNELSPTSVVFEKHKGHIEDPDYTLIPINAARIIQRIGKSLFDPKFQFTMSARRHQMTGYDYLSTPFGKFIGSDSIQKLTEISYDLNEQMRHEADRLVNENYEENYRDTFLFALRFFSREMKELRVDLHKYDGELQLFLLEIAKIFENLKRIEDEFRVKRPKGRIALKELGTPELKTAYKMRGIPRTYKDYRKSLGYTFLYTGFHPMSFIRWEWREEFWLIKDLATARSLLFEPIQPSDQQSLVFDEDE